MHTYLFLLGSTADLCWAELETVLHRFKFPAPELVTTDLAKLTTSESLSNEQLVDLQTTLGGTIKIIRILEETNHTDLSEVSEIVLKLLADDKPKRFVVSEYGRDHLPMLDAIEFKEALRSRGIKSSYVEASRHGANAAQLKRGAEEVYVIQLSDSILYGWTETVQDVDAWAKRDVKKPVRDRERGMLQPKVARMMVNLALGDGNPADSVVLDPFCGTGTILLEAAELGSLNVYGSDFSEEQIIASNKNLTWWQDQSKHDFAFELVRREVSHLTPRDFPLPVTHIVTEPFLGRLRPAPEQLPNIMRGLEKLYRGMIKSFTTLLKPGSRIAIILPSWEIKSRNYQLEQTFADLEKAGFKIMHEPLRAGRVGAITQRFVYVLEYNPYVES
jgi:tRNA G10  N-methylase Trm11